MSMSFEPCDESLKEEAFRRRLERRQTQVPEGFCPDIPDIRARLDRQEYFLLWSWGGADEIAADYIQKHVPSGLLPIYEEASQLESSEAWSESFLPGLPEELLHVFACDCAEDAMFIAFQPYLITKGCADAIDKKRLWIQGQLATDELLQAREEVRRAEAYWACDPDGLNAAIRTSEATTFDGKWGAYRNGDRRRHQKLLADLMRCLCFPHPTGSKATAEHHVKIERSRHWSQELLEPLSPPVLLEFACLCLELQVRDVAGYEYSHGSLSSGLLLRCLEAVQAKRRAKKGAVSALHEAQEEIRKLLPSGKRLHRRLAEQTLRFLDQDEPLQAALVASQGAQTIAAKRSWLPLVRKKTLAQQRALLLRLLRYEGARLRPELLDSQVPGKDSLDTTVGSSEG